VARLGIRIDLADHRISSRSAAQIEGSSAVDN
jgi:hypothetical protein